METRTTTMLETKTSTNSMRFPSNAPLVCSQIRVLLVLAKIESLFLLVGLALRMNRGTKGNVTETECWRSTDGRCDSWMNARKRLFDFGSGSQSEPRAGSSKQV